MQPDLRAYLGHTVQVTVDRPLGTRHPSGHNIWYSLNYGYVSDTVSGDGEPVDAYILGVHEPVEAFEGIVIAVVVRNDDVEDKLVVAPSGRSFSVDQVTALVEFQERFFKSCIVM